MVSRLVFRVCAPMASWGDQGGMGQYRRTNTVPTRSAIVGLVSSALGIRLENDDEFLRFSDSVDVAVKVVAPGKRMTDFHTAQAPHIVRDLASRKVELTHKLNTILSEREYMTDAIYVVAITMRAGQSSTHLDVMKDALHKPLRPLCAGRFACALSAPLMPMVVEGSLKDCLDTEFPPLTKSHKQDAFFFSAYAAPTYYWEGEETEIDGNVVSTTVRDNPISRVRWQFSNRIQHSVTI